ncbi:unnamed protein product, partial [Mesorhabditis belari]|uniref:Bestrophin homolog n=1 Tax=Mesorhabditis belari TaxID=2138241 RepID=A0AAF3EPA3_9BILA
MTVTYTLEVSKAKFWGFPKLLARWKGSIYRLIYREMLVFLIAYYALMLIYRVVLDEDSRKKFEAFALYCREMSSTVMITFVLGFYVTLVMGRWWQQYMNIPWPDRISMEISAYVHGTDERGRMIRRSMARYLNLLSLFTFQNTSTVIKRRFPTMEHLVDAGLMTPEEKIELDRTSTANGEWWLPAHWFTQLAVMARKEGRIHDDFHLKTLIDDLMAYRGMCGMIWSYDWISVPLVYTQVVTIAVYTFFVAALFGSQFLFGIEETSSLSVNYYCPLFTIFQFFFFVGWLKVAESMICPFGEDDDDFDVNWIIDRNIIVAYQIVDTLHKRVPILSRDAFWDEAEPTLPYTEGSVQFRSQPFVGSTTAMNIPERAAQWEAAETMPPISEEDGVIGVYQQKTPKDEDDDSDSDAASETSRKIHHQQGLGGLMLGFSRQNLASRFGSKFGSLNSILGIKPSRPGSPPTVPNTRHTSVSRMRNYDSNASDDLAMPRDAPNSTDASSSLIHEGDEGKPAPIQHMLSTGGEKVSNATSLAIVPEHGVVDLSNDSPRKRVKSSRDQSIEENADNSPSSTHSPNEDYGSRTPLCEKM